MASGVRLTAMQALAAARSRLVGPAAVLLGCALLAACSTTPGVSRSISQLPPLQLEQGSLQVADVPALAPTPDLLAVDQEMLDFMALYTSGVRSDRQRLMMLHRAMKGAGTLDMQYDPLAEGTAQEVFHRGSANCLSYANLFIALAREAGLDASYQWLEVRPQWTRQGERVMRRLHVNVLVDLGREGRYMVDIDPLPSHDVAGSRKISDSVARALYHSNIAMKALAGNDLELAWIQAVRALQLGPREAHLWVNLGAIYRQAGQHREAESSYLYALQLDPREPSAMNNLSVLYSMEGRREEGDYWASQVARHRQANPFYHAWLGDMAAAEDDWRGALEHYQRALKLQPGDSHLLYTSGLIHYKLSEMESASAYLERAIETATLRSDIEAYQLKLQQIQQGQLAGI